MHKIIVSVVGLVALMSLAGCNVAPNGRHFSGRVVSYADSYKSKNSSHSYLSSQGSVGVGRNPTGPAKPGWMSQISWRFLRHDAGRDVYQIEWTFTLDNRSPKTEIKEIAFDGSQAVRVASNEWQVLSIEPGLF